MDLGAALDPGAGRTAATTGRTTVGIEPPAAGGARYGRWHLRFDFDNAALDRLLAQRLGRTTLLTNRLDWTAEQVIEGYSGRQNIERVFRGLKDGDWLGWGPMYHWTDSQIRVPAFYCMLRISLLRYIHRKAEAAWPGLSMDQLIEELGQIQQFALRDPPQGEEGPNRAATIRSKQTQTFARFLTPSLARRLVSYAVRNPDRKFQRRTPGACQGGIYLVRKSCWSPGIRGSSVAWSTRKLAQYPSRRGSS